MQHSFVVVPLSSPDPLIFASPFHVLHDSRALVVRRPRCRAAMMASSSRATRRPPIEVSATRPDTRGQSSYTSSQPSPVV